ncbi:MAG: hypothetical protein KJO64_04545, partial [Bacteroidia bacterium]|nr:hypothetical protein [Bacteroidia bacterium]
AQLSFSYINGIDVVITSDKTKWTRSPVVEMGSVTALNEPSGSGPKKGSVRKSLSVDKNGNYATAGSGVSTNPEDANYISEMGMGWFPGYAINVETGERLNIAFGENSSFAGGNGKDMIWNPTSDVMGPDDPIFGGGHYIFIFDRNGYDADRDVPLYDAGAFVVEKLDDSTPTNEKRNVWKDCIWTSMPLLRPGQELLSSDVKIRLRVAKNYESYVTRVNQLTEASPLKLATSYYVTQGSVTHDGSTYNAGDVFTASAINFTGSGLVVTPPPSNDFNPMYTYSNSTLKPITNNLETAKSALDIVNVVPNPYYAFSGYEKSSLDNRIKITNLPKKCTISIYNTNGTLVRKLNRDLVNSNQTSGSVNTEVNFDTTVDWDLKNEKNIPISSGLYIIHINAGEIGETTLKWFGVMRPVDLVNF